jgi:hypothetical protein
VTQLGHVGGMLADSNRLYFGSTLGVMYLPIP